MQSRNLNIIVCNILNVKLRRHCIQFLKMENVENRKEVLIFAMRVLGGIFVRANRRMHMRYRLYLQHKHSHEKKQKQKTPKKEHKTCSAPAGYERPITRSVTAHQRPTTRSVTARQTATGHRPPTRPAAPPRPRKAPVVLKPLPRKKDHPKNHPNCLNCINFLEFLRKERARSERMLPLLEEVVQALIS